MFERSIQSAILNCDGKIPRNGFEQFDIFAREEVPFHGLPEPKHGHGALLSTARNVIVQVEARDRLLRAGCFPRHIMGVLEKQVALASLRPLDAEEAEIKTSGLLHSERFR